jgi:hypothetical protein
MFISLQLDDIHVHFTVLTAIITSSSSSRSSKTARLRFVQNTQDERSKATSARFRFNYVNLAAEDY